MEGDFIKIKEWLLPLSWLYGVGVGIRNFLFDVNIIKSRTYDIPVISVGNITVGGSGKTPHVEYLVQLLQDKAKVAVLSRGYKRKSKGYILADDNTTADDIGDEPYQMYKKFKNIYVAVDKDRCHGIDRITSDEETKDTDVILLDDAYQHRYVKPGVNILLVDYHRLIIYDKLLPAGRLREPISGKTRADIVIITKCPKDLKPMSYRVLMRAMSLFPYQKLFFTCLEYGEMQPLFNDSKGAMSVEKIKSDDNVMLVTGIASPEQMINDLTPYTKNITHLCFPDHHDFSASDIEKINQTYETLPKGTIIITTEKDASRIMPLNGLTDKVRDNIYILPIQVKLLLDNEDKFNENILSYVQKNSRNSILVKGKNDNKTKDSDNTGNRPRTISFRNN